MNRNRVIELFTRKLTGEATPEELLEYQQLIKTEGETALHELMENWWNDKPHNQNAYQSDSDQHFHQILTTATADEIIEQANAGTQAGLIKKYPSLKKWLFATAAIFIGLMITLNAGLFKSTSGSNYQNNVIVAKRGTKSKLILPDGTQVWLNSESKLTYGSSFSDSIREVTLDGEAYFDVVKDKNHPFVVRTSAISIRVLGTAFNVKSYQQDPTIETTLVRGMIEVHKNNEPSASKIILHPNEKLVYNKPRTISAIALGTVPTTSQLISISTLPKNIADSSRKETSWVYGRLVFDGDSFTALAEKMERWYNVKITIKNSTVANYRFAGVFEKENVDEAFKALQLIAMFKYTINENEIIIEK